MEWVGHSTLRSGHPGSPTGCGCCCLRLQERFGCWCVGAQAMPEATTEQLHTLDTLAGGGSSSVCLGTHTSSLLACGVCSRPWR